MRILYHHRISARDGMSVHVDALIEALRDRGHEVLVSSATSEADRKSGRLEARTNAVRRILPPAAGELLEIAYNLAAYWKLLRIGRKFHPDVLYERYNLFLLAGLWLKRTRRLPMILEINAPLAEERAAFGSLALRSIARWCERTVWRGADAILAVSEVLGQRIRDVCGHDVAIHIIPNGVDLRRFTATAASAAIRKRLGLESAIVLGFSGFVRSWHGLDWAVDALKELPSAVHLVIIGDGPALPELLDRAQTRRVASRIHALGNIEHDQIPAYIGIFDVALQPRAVAYASPLKLFEYMALGRAIVAPDQPNIREILTHEKSALLFSADDERSFVEALTRFCREPTLRSLLGRGARETVEERQLTWVNNAARVETIAAALTRKGQRL